MQSRKVILVTFILIVCTTLLACSLFGFLLPNETGTGPDKTTITEPAPASTAEKSSSDTPAPPPAGELPPSALEPQPAAPPHFRDGEHITLSSIHMLDTSYGWGISGAYILATEDGGRTWREVTPPEQFPPDTSSEAFGAFLDPQTAWVIFAADDQISPSASVWHTTNGGQTWTPSAPLFHQAFGDRMWAEFAVHDARTAWVMIRGMYVGAGTHYSAELFHTEDGGITWNSLDGDVGVDYTGLVFVDTQMGWLTWQTTGAYAAAPPSNARTQDGGITWEAYELPPPVDNPTLFESFEYCEPYQPNLLSSQDVRLLVACFEYGFPPKKFVSYLYVSSDGGENWQTYPLPTSVLASQVTLIFFDTDDGLLLGREMYRTSDGGTTWSRIKKVSWDGQFSFVDSQHGWAIARADDEIALVSTSDGGESWSILDPIAVR